MSDYVYPPVVAAALTAFKALGLKLRVEGGEHVPTAGSAVMASNHVSHLDFIFVGLGARQSRRYVRFMAKEPIFAHRVAGPLMRGMHHISVDREAGMQSFRDALAALKAGEVVGLFPRRRSVGRLSRRSSRPEPSGLRRPPSRRSFRSGSGAVSGSGRTTSTPRSSSEECR